MRRPASIFAAACAIFTASTSLALAACEPAPRELAGRYMLSGEMEMGAQLILSQNGQFEFMLVYGATDQYGQGCWTVSDGLISLRKHGHTKVPTTHSPAARDFNGMVLELKANGELGWPLVGFKGVFIKVRE